MQLRSAECRVPSSELPKYRFALGTRHRALFLAALLLLACPGNQRHEDESQNALPKTSTTTANPQTVPEKSPKMNPATPPTALGNQPAAAANPEIQVQLTEYEIQMPDAIAAGAQTFHITDAGRLNHNFVIEGNGISQKLANDLTRGDSTDMTVNLKPGTFTVYCPVDKHRARGMQRTITVR